MTDLDTLLKPYNASIAKHIVNSRGHAFQIRHFENETWVNYFIFGWYETFDHLSEAFENHIQECETMNIFGTNLFPYLQGDMFKDAGTVNLTMKNVRMVEVANGNNKEHKPVLYFHERDKGLILNKTNAKEIAKLYGAETDEWGGKKIGIYAERGRWFGVDGYAIRITSPVEKKTRTKTHSDETLALFADAVADSTGASAGAFDEA